MEATDLSTKQNSGPTIHIDGLKKKLIADQIRQRVQSKPMQNTTPSILHPMKRGRGRPPKSSSKDGVSIEDIHVSIEMCFKHIDFASVICIQLHVQSVPITTKVMSSNPVHGEVYSMQHMYKFNSLASYLF